MVLRFDARGEGQVADGERQNGAVIAAGLKPRSSGWWQGGTDR